MNDLNIRHLAFPDDLASIPLDVRVALLERLVLFMTKFIAANGPLSPTEHGIASIIEDLRRRHPDV